MLPLSPQLLIEAQWPSYALADVAAETVAQLAQAFTGFELTGRRLAVAVGSRGIDQIALVAQTAVQWLKERGAQPFVFPAMGSHGGATAAGQREVLATLGVTEASLGAPIDDLMEVVEVGRTPSGIRMFMARAVLNADAILLINRVKPHTDFVSAELGSGIRKMCALGLGKAEGALEYHNATVTFGYETMIREVSDFVLSQAQPIFGLALVEDPHHHLGRIAAWPQHEIIAREPALLALAKEWMPSLPFPEIDVLIVDEIGKNISGAGMDPNIIGRSSDGLKRADRRAELGALWVRGLSEATHGNAIGMGMADVVSLRLVENLDRHVTYTNTLTARVAASARIPMHFPTETDCLRAALRLAGVSAESARIVRIKNTLALERFVVTANYAAAIAERSNLRSVGEAQPWRFNDQGDLDTAADLLA